MSPFKIICHAGFIWTLLDFTSAQGKLRSPVVGQDGVFGDLSKSKPAKPTKQNTKIDQLIICGCISSLSCAEQNQLIQERRHGKT